MNFSIFVATLAVLSWTEATFSLPWLYQQPRQARHLLQPYFVPPQHYQARTFAAYPSATRQTYIVPYSPLLTHDAWSPRPAYFQAPIVHYVAPDAHHTSFSKRVDSTVEKGPEDGSISHEHQGKTPCLLHTSLSEHYPVYVLPPKNFQPIVYQQSVPVVIQANPNLAEHTKVKQSAEELWYESGSATDIKSLGQKHEENEINISRNKKIIYVPVVENGFNQFPVFEAVIQEVKPATEEATKKPSGNAYEGSGNWYNGKTTNVNTGRRYKTKLPVGMTSFFLGGIRGVSGRHWNMPATLVKQLEFMPNISPLSPENKYLPEEGYVKPVDTTSDQSAAPIPGDPEKEESNNQEQKTKTTDNKKGFEHNTIIDSPLDLEAQESSHSKIQNLVVPTVVSREGTKTVASA